MPSELTKILQLSQYHKSNEISFFIYADLYILIAKIKREIILNSSATKVSKQISSGFSMSTISSFKDKENKYDVYRDKDCK